MGRIKASNRSANLSTEKVRMVELPAPKMVTVDLNLANDVTISESKAIARLTDSLVASRLRDALVKLRVAYRKGAESAAMQVIEQVTERISAFARYVFRPEISVLSEAQARIQGMTEDLTLLEAVKVWLDNRPGPYNQDEVLKTMTLYINRLPDQKERILNPREFILTGIEVENFMPFGGVQAIEGIREGVYGVTGVYTGVEGRSNRAGKSAFLEAVLFGLFGDARSVDSIDQYIHKGEDEMRVKLSLLVEDEPMVVTRTHARNGKSAVSVNDMRALKVKDGNKLIVERLGFSKEDFVRSAFVLQNELYGILSEKNSAIKQDLINWLDLGIWEQVEGLIGRDIASRKVKFEKIVAKIEVLDEILEKDCPTEAQCEEIRKAIHTVKVAYEKLADSKVELSTLKSRLAVIEKCKRLHQEIAERDKEQLKKKLNLIEQAIKSTDRDIQVISEEIGKIDLEKYRKTAERGFDGVCPVDGVNCPRTREINADMECHRGLYEEARQLYNEKKKRQVDYTSQLCDLRDKAKDFAAKIADVEQKERFIHEYLVGDELEKEPVLRRRVADLEGMLATERDSYDEIVRLQGKLSQMEQAIAAAQDAKGELEGLQEEYALVEEEIAFLGYLRFLCSKQGIPSMQIENAVLTIEGQANEILKRMGVEHRLEFGFERELKRKASVCYACGYSFDNSENSCKVCGKERGNGKSEELVVGVRDAGSVQTFDQDSGGGKTLLALAVRIALAKYLGIRTLFLDEVCGSLDVENLRAMIETVGNLTKEGFPQVFIISHRHEVANVIPNTIVVQRDALHGKSELLWA